MGFGRVEDSTQFTSNIWPTLSLQSSDTPPALRIHFEVLSLSCWEIQEGQAPEEAMQ